MSLATPRKHADIPDELLTRLRRMIIGLLTIGLAVGAGWLGIILAPHIGKILLTAAAIVPPATLWMAAKRLAVVGVFVQAAMGDGRAFSVEQSSTGVVVGIRHRRDWSSSVVV